MLDRAVYFNVGFNINFVSFNFQLNLFVTTKIYECVLGIGSAENWWKNFTEAGAMYKLPLNNNNGAVMRNKLKSQIWYELCIPMSVQFYVFETIEC